MRETSRELDATDSSSTHVMGDECTAYKTRLAAGAEQSTGQPWMHLAECREAA